MSSKRPLLVRGNHIKMQECLVSCLSALEFSTHERWRARALLHMLDLMMIRSCYVMNDDQSDRLPSSRSLPYSSVVYISRSCLFRCVSFERPVDVLNAHKENVREFLEQKFSTDRCAVCSPCSTKGIIHSWWHLPFVFQVN